MPLNTYTTEELLEELQSRLAGDELLAEMATPEEALTYAIDCLSTNRILEELNDADACLMYAIGNLSNDAILEEFDASELLRVASRNSGIVDCMDANIFDYSDLRDFVLDDMSIGEHLDYAGDTAIFEYVADDDSMLRNLAEHVARYITEEHVEYFHKDNIKGIMEALLQTSNPIDRLMYLSYKAKTGQVIAATLAHLEE